MWGALVYDLKRRAVMERRWAERQRREKMESALAERLQRIQANSLAERRGRRKVTQRGRKRQRDGEDSTAAQQARSFDGAPPYSDENEMSVSLPASLWENEGSVGARHDRRVPGGEQSNNTNSLSNLCESVLQLTEFNAEEWLNA
ncbi:hypothetical protein DQ04_08151000 [Trypanosoma grayi]|uniref:hypothetical protein n=1 Tax=Trypanosoma grayi TaxID=71804 RepID=UPI0004F3F5DB|nr:hypothetical protein DQ04_08151000 [Trypanosoma grayi]KEG08040.1 hypothetical protein DQ04_08151000 [Trypanosoma grayi]